MDFKKVGIILMLFAAIPTIANLVTMNIVGVGFGFIGFLSGAFVYYEGE